MSVLRLRCPKLKTLFPVSFLSCIPLFLNPALFPYPSFPASLISYISPFLHQSFSASLFHPASILSHVHILPLMRPSFPLSLNSFITSVYYNASLPSCIPPVLHLSILRDPSFRASFCHESAFPASHLSCILPSLHPT